MRGDFCIQLRNPRLYRHKHKYGLTQIANEMARCGLCDILIPMHGASNQEYLQAFRNRLEQAVSVVRTRSPNAIVLIVVDAADNLGMAAEGTPANPSFAPDLLQEQPPDGCRVVALARTHRAGRYLEPRGEIERIDLEPFDSSESAIHLRRKFPDATDSEFDTFHRFTDRNPRVQANALAMAEDLSSLMDCLGPSVETVEDLISGQLNDALDTVIREQLSSRGEIEPLLIALAALPPPIPIRILAQAVEISDEAVRSFISDFGNGRYIVIAEDAIQFRDEPVETWFHEKFAGTPERAGQIAERLDPLAIEDGYVAAALPILLHRAGRYDELVQLALAGAELEAGDPVEKREVLLRRVQYALKAALAQNRLMDAAKLLLRAGEEMAADNRQSGFLMDNADLVSILAGSDTVNDFIFRRRAWALEKGYIHCAAMLAADNRNRVEAERFLDLAMEWLKDWFARQDAKSEEERQFDREDRIGEKDIVAYAEVIGNLHGVEAMVRFMGNWRDWFAFNVIRIVAVHLLDRGDRVVVEEMLAAAGDRVAIRLAVILEMSAIGIVPVLPEIRRTVDLLMADETAVDPEAYQQGYADSEAPLAIVATAEAAARCGMPSEEILALLGRYPMPHERVYEWHRRSSRSAIFRAKMLRAVLEDRQPTLDDLMPGSIRKAREEKNHQADDRENRRFQEIYGTLLPWYTLRAFAIIGRAEGWDNLVATAQQECKADRWSRRDHPELAIAAGEAGGVWLDATIWAGRGDDASIGEIEHWLEEKQVSVNRTVLTRRAAHAGKACYDSMLRLAHRAKEIIEGERGGARETADDLAALARAVLPLDREEAAGHFQKALEYLGRLGHDELQERLMAMLAIAGKAAENGHPDPREAYRVARMGELFHAYNDHKFPWDTVADAIARLCPASGFAVISRWNDRGQAWLGDTLPSVTLALLEAEKIRPTVAASLHSFGGYWEFRKRASLFFEKAADKETRQAVLDRLAQDEEFDPADRRYRNFDNLLAVAKKYGLERQRLQERVDFQASVPDRDGHQYAARHENPELAPEPDWDELLKGIDIHTPKGVDKAIGRWQAADLTSRDWNKHT
uniref:Uncharacterized protein n=1 Tax=Candidatus Kentrum sp. FM TaxID=2126340 RepID=A0A450WBX5_9GAMM|nr:MAG: hypothetical protein BECKFM1743A_GA0114220_103113 [Candidatus Kentron sp. FM]VFJ62743.1 MAG: hypothetical protein BECKFM1743C_GA0114222_103253 [Candidatus Kentron sp. FM]VFK14461.1 MAG: hypothetical protein BECKFM1743B_GA0114221_103223 [Candidatus Kentron sp. FM]